MKFYIRTTKAEGVASLYTDIQRRQLGLKFKLSTPIEVSIKEWNKANLSPANYAQFLKTHKDIATKMTNVQAAIENALNEGKIDRNYFADLVNYVCYEDEKKRVEEISLAQEEAMAKAENAPIAYLTSFIDGMKQGRRLTNGKRYKITTIHTFEGLYNYLSEFVKTTPFDWEDVNKQLIDRFVTFMTKQGLMASTINAHLRVLRVIFNSAYNEEIHSNARGCKAFTQIKVNEDEVRKEIYLTQAELDALYSLPLLGGLAETRDVFLVGCYTCQRYSDYSKIERGDFCVTARGTKVVKLIQQKTGNSVTIPVLNDNLLHIMERYKYNLPTVDPALFNLRIKEVLKVLSQSVPTLLQLERTTLSIDERKKEKEGKVTFLRDEAGKVVKQRWELVSSHTARRSGITNLYLTGKFDTLSLMKISGHKSESAFMKYIRVTQDEYADRIAEAFNGDIKMTEAL